MYPLSAERTGDPDGCSSAVPALPLHRPRRTPAEARALRGLQPRGSGRSRARKGARLSLGGLAEGLGDEVDVGGGGRDEQCSRGVA